MPRKFVTPIDLAGFELQNAKIHVLASDPAGLVTGDKGLVWFNSTQNRLKYWNGSAAELKGTDSDLLQGQNSSYHLTRTNHTGTQLAATISDFNSAVRLNRIDQLLAAGADVAHGGFKITSLGDGVAASDAATYGQVLTLANNQSFKAACRVATTANIASLAGGAPNTLDGVTLAANDRVLVKDQTTASTNGIYTVTTVGTGVNGTWARATDFDASAEVVPGSIIAVTEGTLSLDKLFMLTTNGPIVIGTTALVFGAYGASTGEIGVGGAGMTKTGSGTVTYDVGAGTGIIVAADTVGIDTTLVGRKILGVIPTTTGGIFTVSGSTVTVNHALNNFAPDITVRYYTSPGSGNTQGQVIEVDNTSSDANNVVITLPAAPLSNQYYVSVRG